MDDRSSQVMRRIAGAVRRAQRSRDLSDDELSDRAGIDRAVLDAILRGEKADLPLHFVYLLAGALRVEPAQLLAGIAWIPDGRGGGEYRVEDPEGD